MDALATGPKDYPVDLSATYPETIDRWARFWRLIVDVPVLLLHLVLVMPAAGIDSEHGLSATPGFLRIVFSPVLVVRFLAGKKYPVWLLNAHRSWAEYFTGLGLYMAMISERFSSSKEDQGLHIEIPMPGSGEDMSRWLPLVKWLLAAPHYILLTALWVGVFVATIVAWCAVLTTGRYPRPLFGFICGVFRWTLRVDCYAFLLMTDRYPRFTLQ